MNQLASSSSRQRIYSIDILRGVVMIIMALDHTRDFFHFDAFIHDPLNLNTTSPFLFFTRWITHFCAPVFVFLAGTSAFLQTGRKTKAEVSSLLLKRGLWLILIEIVVITFAWTFDVGYHLIALQVIWAIGFSMALLSIVIWLPFNLVLVLGLLITFGHNILDYTGIMQDRNAGFLFDLLFRGNFAIHQFAPGRMILTIYAGVPWAGLMMLGYCFGTIYRADVDSAKRKRILTYLGLGCLVLFILLRSANIYGDPLRWSAQKNGLFTFLSFINVTKYPPSLQYMCLFIGPSLFFLALLEKTNNVLSRAIVTFGRVPFFYYVIHLYAIHAAEMIAYLSRGHSFAEGNTLRPGQFKFFAPGEGYSLTVVYIVWIILVIALYPLCKWFNEYKNRKRAWWMSYV